MIEATIEKAFVHYSNDPSVGMFPFGYEIGLHLINPEKEDLNEVRQKISELYELTEGEKPTWVMFDFEIQEQCEQEQMQEEMHERVEDWERLSN